MQSLCASCLSGHLQILCRLSTGAEGIVGILRGAGMTGRESDTRENLIFCISVWEVNVNNTGHKNQ